MGEISPDTLANWLVQDAKNVAFRPLLELSAEVLGSRIVALSAEQRADHAEKLLYRVSEALNRIAAESIEDGVEPGFELSDTDETFYFKSRESAASKFRDELLSLEPKEFENFCARVLSKFGADSRVTGKPGDGGIDFVAKNLMLAGQGAPSPIGARALVIGQAKRYAKDSLIAENDLRSFVGAAIRRFSDPQEPHAYRAAVLSPLSLAFWTTSDFQPSAKKYARAVGLWYLNGIGLAQLALRLGVTAKA